MVEVAVICSRLTGILLSNEGEPNNFYLKKGDLLIESVIFESTIFSLPLAFKDA